MMRMLVHTALGTRQPLSEVMQWDAQTLATVHEWMEEQAEAAKGR